MRQFGQKIGTKKVTIRIDDRSSYWLRELNIRQNCQLQLWQRCANNLWRACLRWVRYVVESFWLWFLILIHDLCIFPTVHDRRLALKMVVSRKNRQWEDVHEEHNDPMTNQLKMHRVMLNLTCMPDCSDCIAHLRYVEIMVKECLRIIRYTTHRRVKQEGREDPKLAPRRKYLEFR